VDEPERNNSSEDKNLSIRIILKWILKTLWDMVDSDMAQGMEQEKKHLVPYNAGNFLTISVLTFQRSSLLYGGGSNDILCHIQP
jgi:hypothetical protein